MGSTYDLELRLAALVGILGVALTLLLCLCSLLGNIHVSKDHFEQS